MTFDNGDLYIGMFTNGEMIDSNSYIPVTDKTTMSSSESERNAVRKEELIRHISSRTAGTGDGAQFSYDDVMKSLELDDDDHEDDDTNDASDDGHDADKIDSNSNNQQKKKKTHRLHSKSHMNENEEFVNGTTTLHVMMD
mmetsp:Transcript_23253/g.24770  ORF Transcript_23253/g.24770 Transcript_23253/m.24770 type:complete len:140 (+) Transcript_23253:150-569(+)